MLLQASVVEPFPLQYPNWRDLRSNLAYRAALSSCRGHCESETQYAQSRSCSVGAGRLSPVGKSPIPKKTMMDCFEMVPANSEQILNLTVDSKESLSLLDRLEPSHLPLLLPGMLMGDFSSVVFILTRSMLD